MSQATSIPQAAEVRTPEALRTGIAGLEQAGSLDVLTGILDPIASVAGRGSVGTWLRGEWAGHALHPALTDLPLGCWISAGILDVVGGRGSRRAAQRLIGVGLLAVPLTAATGLADFKTIDEQRSRRVAAVHGVGNVAVVFLYLLSWRARRRRRWIRGVVWGLGGAGLAAATGYLGGHLSFARGVGVGARGLTEF